MENEFSWKRAAKVTYPVAMGYAPAGMAFGILATSAGIPWWLAILISIVALSGAAQYAMIDAVKAAAGVMGISLQTLTINLRHVFYGLPLLDALPKNRLARTYCYFCLTDEGFSVLTTLSKRDQKGLFLKISFLVHSYWVLATIAGVILGEGIGSLIPNLDFALSSLFVILWYEQVKMKKVWWPSVLALGVFLLMLWILPESVLIMALVVSIAIILVRAILFERKKPLYHGDGSLNEDALEGEK